MQYMPTWIYSIDILFFFVVLLAVLRGVRRGFYRELAGVLPLLLLMYGFYFGYPSIRASVGYAMSGLYPVAQTSISILILFSLYMIVYVGARMFNEHVLQARLGVFTDTFSGFLMGFIRGVVLLFLFISVLSELPNLFLYEVFTTKSVAGQFLSEHLFS